MAKNISSDPTQPSVVADQTARREHVRAWIARNSGRVAKGGLGSALLMLPVLAQAQAGGEQYVVAESLQGVTDAEMMADGNLHLTMSSGQTVVIAPEDFRVLENGSIAISPNAAEIVAEVAAAGGGMGAGAGALAAGAGALGIAAAASGGGEDGPESLNAAEMQSLSNTETEFDAPDGSTSVTVDIDGTTYTATPNPDGSWSLSLTASQVAALPQGEQEITVTATDGTTETGSNTVTVNIDTIAPTVSIDPISGDGVLSAAEQGAALSVSGTTDAEDGQQVTVNVAGTDYTATASGGAWSVDVPATDLAGLADGASVAVTADVEDAAGNPATQATASFDTDFSATIAIDQIAGGELNAGDVTGDLTVTGTTDAENGQTVTLSFAGTEYTGTVNGGKWSVVVDGADLAQLTDDITEVAVSASVSDAAGNSASTSQTLAADLTGYAVSIDPVTADNVLNAAEQGAGDGTISGTSDAPDGASVTVTIQGTDYTGTVSSSGAWSVTVPAADITSLADGDSIDVTATVADTEGTTGTATTTFTTDFTGPMLTIDAIAGDDVINTVEQNADLTLSGSTDLADGETFTVTMAGKDYTASVSGGAWTATVPAADLGALADGASVDVSATVADAAGNETTATASGTTNFTAPAPALTIDAIAGDDVINSAEQSANLTISGTTDVADGSTVTVTMAGNSYTATVSGGTWSATVPTGDLTGLTDGASVAVEATVADSGGYETTATSVVTTDFTAPTLSIDSVDSGGAAGAIIAGTDLEIAGSTDAADGSTVTVSLGGTDYTATANAGGWTLTVPAADLPALDAGNTTSLEASVTDPAGNAATDSQTVVAYESGAYFLLETGATGTTVNMSMFADPDRDVNDGFPVTADMTFDPAKVSYDAGSAVDNGAFDLFLTNDGDATTGIVKFAGALTGDGDPTTPDFDLTQSIVDFTMTDQDAAAPFTLNLTSPEGGPSATVIGSANADTIAAGNVDTVIRAHDGDDSIDVSSVSVSRVVLEGDQASNGTDTITGFTLGADSALADEISIEVASPAALRGDASTFDELTDGGAIGANSAFVNFTTALGGLTAGDFATAAEGLTGEAGGDVFYMLASDGSDAALARVEFSAPDSATTEILAQFTGMGDTSGLTEANVIGLDPTGTVV